MRLPGRMWSAASTPHARNDQESVKADNLVPPRPRIQTKAVAASFAPTAQHHSTPVSSGLHVNSRTRERECRSCAHGSSGTPIRTHPTERFLIRTDYPLGCLYTQGGYARLCLRQTRKERSGMSNLIHFLNGAFGRVLRVALGVALVWYGLLILGGTAGGILAVVGLVPIRSE